MAAPLLAAAAAGAKGAGAAKGASWGGKFAAGSRSAGGSLMGNPASSAGMKSLGSKMLKVKDTDKMVRFLDISQTMLTKIFPLVGKILGFLSKHSPALAQQMIILTKAFSLFLRPIGDIMARWVTPMARWLIKVAMLWYKLFGQGNAEEDPEDKKKRLLAEADYLEGIGDTEGADKKRKEAEGIGDGGGFFSGILESFKNLMAGLFSSENLGGLIGGVQEFFGRIWSEFLPEQAKSTWDALVETGKAFWKVLTDIWNVISPVLVPILQVLAGVLGGILLIAFKQVEEGLKALTKVFEFISGTINVLKISNEMMWDVFKKIGNYLKESFIFFFEKLWEVIKGIGSFIADTFVNNLNSAKDAWVNLTDWVIKQVDRIKGLLDSAGSLYNKAKEKAGDAWNRLTGGEADGGAINTTGFYKLHAGERVLTAGENSRLSGNKAINITNNISVSATINNDMDIRQLAKRLAEINESELRRRVSYGGY